MTPYTRPSHTPNTYRIAVALAVATASYIAFTLYLIAVNYTPGPVKDDWEVIPFLEQVFAGHFSPQQLWEPYGGAHRIVLTKLLFVADYHWFNGTNVLQTFTATGLQLLAMAFWLLALRTSAAPALQQAAIAMTGALFLFHSVQLFNLTYAFDVQWFISSVFAIATLYVYHMRTFSLPNVLLMTVLATTASLGNAAGCMVWPTLVCYALLMRRPRHELLTWLCLTITIALLWGSNLHGQLTEPGVTIELPPWHQWVPAWLAGLVIFLARLIGNPWTALDNTAGLILGCAGLVTVAYCLIRYRRQTPGLFLCIALYALLAAMAIALGRSAFEQEAATPRFYTITLLFWAGLLSHLVLQKAAPTAVISILACVIALPLHVHHARINTDITERARHAQLALMIGMQDWDAIRSTLSWHMPLGQRNPGRDHQSFLQTRNIAYYQLPHAEWIGRSISIPPASCGPWPGQAIALTRPDEYRLAFPYPLTNGLWLTATASGHVNGAIRQYRPRGWLWPLGWLADTDASWHGYARQLPAWAILVRNGQPACRLAIQPPVENPS